ncbi:MAG: hypothetical protein Harvfovirus34_14 [Harvfovirus sp.]|uniref:Uncharacterized protein n=1 Tax=Harvfovirus sp. TaxID=2487768 RepID=A0A3G5A7M0_9VIRU|nr:MAG: hypothetical protein Harvfovirus34_14 [Harvfovirus sp.]
MNLDELFAVSVGLLKIIGDLKTMEQIKYLISL